MREAARRGPSMDDVLPIATGPLEGVLPGVLPGRHLSSTEQVKELIKKRGLGSSCILQLSY
ncbi:hypothetical protein V8C37DRAFT_397525 [Trichoderma ceciliae]